MKAFLFIGEILKRYPLIFITTITLLLLLTLVETLSIVSIGPLVDFLMHPDLKGISSITQKVISATEYLGISLTLNNYLIFFIVFIVLASIFRIFAKHSILKTTYAFVHDLMLGMFDDFFNAKWYFFSSNKEGELLNAFNRELNVVGNAFNSMSHLFVSVLRLIFCLAVPFCISWRVTGISLLTACILSWPFIFLGKVSYYLGIVNTETSNRLNTILHENISMAKIVLGFGNQRKSSGMLDSTFEVHRKATMKSQVIGFAIPTLYHPLAVLIITVALFSGRRFGVPLSNMAILLTALLQSVISIGDLTSHKHLLDNFYPSYEQINKLRERSKELRQPTGGKKFSGFDKGVTIENVTYAYPNHEPVLLDINMNIPKGKMIAIVGGSGEGKSTLIDIIMGFNEPLKGRIAFDGIDLRDFDISSYRRHLGYVPQDSVLFNMSIKDNLFWSKDNAVDEEIKSACRQANADEFIEEFPEGYNTIVGDRGVRLSGGQRQRIALARAILRKPYLMILDEATSSLDTRSERLIQEAIERIAKETTVIVIAHRLSTIINADYIYVLKKGRVVEQGTYEDLINIKGHFNQMAKLQVLETA